LAAVFLFDAHAGGYRRLVAIGYSEDGAQRDFSPGHGLVGQAAASGKCTVTCLDGRQRPAVAAGFARLGLDRLYHLPVMHSDGCLAVVEVGAMRELGEPHWLWLQQAAERLSVALIMSAEVEAPSALRASARSPDESLFTASLPDARPDDYGEAAVWRQQGHGAGRSMMVEGDGQCG
jgi:hypothetical protein